jgi:hypothetical protein
VPSNFISRITASISARRRGARRHPTEGKAFAQQGEFLIDPLRVGGHARQDLAHLGRRVHRNLHQQPREAAVKATLRTQAHAAVADERLEAQVVLQLVNEDVERRLVDGRQRRTLDHLRPLERALRCGIARCDGLGRGVAEAVAVAVVADAAGPLRVGRHQGLPSLVEEGMQRPVRSGRRGVGRPRWRRMQRREDDEQQPGGNADER